MTTAPDGSTRSTEPGSGRPRPERAPARPRRASGRAGRASRARARPCPPPSTRWISPGQVPCRPQSVFPANARAQTYLGLRVVVERSLAACDAIDLAARAAAPRRERRRARTGDGAVTSFSVERRDRLDLPDGADAQDPAVVLPVARSRSAASRPARQRTGSPRAMPSTRFHSPRQDQRSLGGHRNPARLAEREIRRGVARPRSSSWPPRQRRGGRRRGTSRAMPGTRRSDAPGHQILGSTLRFSGGPTPRWERAARANRPAERSVTELRRGRRPGRGRAGSPRRSAGSDGRALRPPRRRRARRGRRAGSGCSAAGRSGRGSRGPGRATADRADGARGRRPSPPSRRPRRRSAARRRVLRHCQVHHDAARCSAEVGEIHCGSGSSRPAGRLLLGSLDVSDPGALQPVGVRDRHIHAVDRQVAKLVGHQVIRQQRERGDGLLPRLPGPEKTESQRTVALVASGSPTSRRACARRVRFSSVVSTLSIAMAARIGVSIGLWTASKWYDLRRRCRPSSCARVIGTIVRAALRRCRRCRSSGPAMMEPSTGPGRRRT